MGAEIGSGYDLMLLYTSMKFAKIKKLMCD